MRSARWGFGVKLFCGAKKKPLSRVAFPYSRTSYLKLIRHLYAILFSGSRVLEV